MNIIREKENQIINIRIWNEREKEDGFLDISEDLSGQILGEDQYFTDFLKKDPTAAQIVDELKWWKEEIALWNEGTNHDKEELDIDGTYYLTIEIETNGEEPRIYFVIDQFDNDIFTTLCRDKEEANREARNRWDSLSYKEKKHHSICAAYTKRTSNYYDDIGEDWDPFYFNAYSYDDDDFDSNRRLDYKYYDCGLNFVMFDGHHKSKTVIDDGYMQYFFDNPDAYGSIEDMIDEIRKELEEEVAEHFPGNDEDRVEDVIDSILITVGYLLNDNLWNYDFETGKRTDE